MIQFATDERVALERLGDEIAELAAHVHAATGRLLLRLSDFDRREGWVGFRSCAHWLSWRTGIAPGAAREKVRVARALDGLPLLAGALGRGELSYAKVRALTRVATPSNEADLLELARQSSAAQVERVVRAWRRADRLEEAADERARHRSRSLTIHPDEDGMVVVRGRLDPEVGALLERALEAATEALHGRRTSGEREMGDDAQARRADAIGLIAELALRAMTREEDSRPAREATRGPSPARPVQSRADRFLVHLYVDAEALRTGSDSGQSVLADRRISAETSRRLSCDAGRVLVAHDPTTGEEREPGRVRVALDPGTGGAREVGRRQRTVSPALRRALERRDRGCRFPGCGNRYCDAHHIVHWIDGGPTTLENTVLLCRRHHRAVHEDGFGITMTEGALTFLRPDGRPLPEAPPPPALPEDTVAMLRDTSPSMHGWTAAPLAWPGHRLDMDQTLRAFRPL
jgi:hypothetical protein